LLFPKTLLIQVHLHILAFGADPVFGHSFALSRTEAQGRMLKSPITNTATEMQWILHGRLVAPWSMN